MAATEIMTSDDSIELKVDTVLVARFDDCGNGMEGEIFEGDNCRLSGSDLIRIAMFLLSKARDRAELEEDRP